MELEAWIHRQDNGGRQRDSAGGRWDSDLIPILASKPLLTLESQPLLSVVMPPNVYPHLWVFILCFQIHFRLRIVSPISESFLHLQIPVLTSVSQGKGFRDGKMDFEAEIEI